MSQPALHDRPSSQLALHSQRQTLQSRAGLREELLRGLPEGLRRGEPSPRAGESSRRGEPLPSAGAGDRSLRCTAVTSHCWHSSCTSTHDLSLGQANTMPAHPTRCRWGSNVRSMQALKRERAQLQQVKGAAAALDKMCCATQHHSYADAKHVTPNA